MAFILWASAPVKAAVVTHVILWGAFLACTLTNRGISSATIATSSIKKGEILRIKSLAYDVRELICLAKDKKLQKTTEKLYDAIVSSQAQSCTAAIPIEKELRESISELSDHIRSGNEDGAQRIVDKALVLLGERESSIQKSRM